jgi:hypothetical protein
LIVQKNTDIEHALGANKEKIKDLQTSMKDDEVLYAFYSEEKSYTSFYEKYIYVLDPITPKLMGRK